MTINFRSRLFVILMPVIMLCACHKSQYDNPAAAGAAHDSVAQSIYVVHREAGEPDSGMILLSPFSLANQLDSGRLMMMDGAGHLLRQLSTPAAAMDFRAWRISGQTRYTWFVFDPSLFNPATPGSEEGYVVIADANLTPIRRVNFQASGNVQAAGSQNLDAHDFILIDDNHYITLSYLKHTVNNAGGFAQAYVATPVIQEILNDQIVWQWDAEDYPEFYTTSVESNNFADQQHLQDYMHMNAMAIDPKDGNLVCSFRNCDQVVKLNRNTGGIMWRLGGADTDFPMSDDMRFVRQHSVAFADDGNTLLIFDNGDATLRPYSRVVEFQLSEQARKVSSFKAYRIPEPFTQYMGSVQKSGSRYLICGGSANYVLDVDYTSGEKWLELDGSLSSYRAYKYAPGY